MYFFSFLKVAYNIDLHMVSTYFRVLLACICYEDKKESPFSFLGASGMILKFYSIFDEKE